MLTTLLTSPFSAGDPPHEITWCVLQCWCLELFTDWVHHVVLGHVLTVYKHWVDIGCGHTGSTSTTPPPHTGLAPTHALWAHWLCGSSRLSPAYIPSRTPTHLFTMKPGFMLPQTTSRAVNLYTFRLQQRHYAQKGISLRIFVLFHFIFTTPFDRKYYTFLLQITHVYLAWYTIPFLRVGSSTLVSEWCRHCRSSATC